MINRSVIKCKGDTILCPSLVGSALKDDTVAQKCKGDTILCPSLVGSALKDDTVENRQGQGIMSPKVIYGQELKIAEGRARKPRTSSKVPEITCWLFWVYR